MPGLNELLKSDQAKKLINDADALQNLKADPETKRLMEIISRQAGNNLDQMARSASSGDTSQLMGTIQKLMNDPESQRLLDSISKRLSL